MKNKKKARVIAFYLPQYHPIPENDQWWGKGFTEWTNVGKAKSLFKGHYQPKVPADLGYYDLRLPEVREAQVELAKEAGIDGFCYYHYWFEEGKELMQRPFDEVVNSGKPDFPFCLCWANESWHAKFWNKDGSSNNKLLMEQKYLGKEDNEKHFYRLLSAFKDHRYLKIDGKPIFCIYKPLDFINIKDFMFQWNDLAKKENLAGIFFIGQTVKRLEIEDIFALNFDAVNLVRLYDKHQNQSYFNKIIRNIKCRIFKSPFVYSYKKMIPLLIGEEEKQANVYPTLIPNWDHTPRSSHGGFVLQGSNPDLFGKHIDSVLEIIKSKEEKNRIIFLKSWNEWGEGNYMEPDLKYGKGYIKALSKKILK